MKDLHYINKNGDTVFRAEYYKRKGSCCKSACLHCPYGHTLKMRGLVFFDVKKKFQEESSELYQSIFSTENVSSSLLESGFGKKNQVKLNNENFMAMALKDHFCGLVQIKEKKYLKHFLALEFSDQNITELHIREFLEKHLNDEE